MRERAAGGDPLELVETAIAVAGGANDAAGDRIEHYVGAARAAKGSRGGAGAIFGVWGYGPTSTGSPSSHHTRA